MPQELEENSITLSQTSQAVSVEHAHEMRQEITVKEKKFRHIHPFHLCQHFNIVILQT